MASAILSSSSSSYRRTVALLTTRRILLWINCLLLGIGIGGGPLVMRLYYIHGGNRIWLQAFLETAGFPIMIFPMAFSFFRRPKSAADSDCRRQQRLIISITPRLVLAAAVVGIIAGLADYSYAKGISLIPVSTSSLILSTQLAFTAVFCYLIVKQRFTPFSVNAVMLLTVAAVVLALHTSGDRPAGESNAEYLMGFFMTLASAALFAVMFPLIELAYTKAELPVNYDLVMEMQFVLSFTATAFCAIGMLVQKDFQGIRQEAREFELGQATYYVVLVASAVIWQLFYLGGLGVVHYGSSLLSGVIIAVSLPISEILAVLIYREKFQAQKGISLALSIWGFISYFYGEISRIKRDDNTSTTATATATAPAQNHQGLIEASITAP